MVTNVIYSVYILQYDRSVVAFTVIFLVGFLGFFLLLHFIQFSNEILCWIEDPACLLATGITPLALSIIVQGTFLAKVMLALCHL